MHRDDGSPDAPTFEELRRRLRTRQEDFRISEVAEGRRKPGERTLGADGEFVLMPYSAARRVQRRGSGRLTAGIALSSMLALGVAGWLFLAPNGEEAAVRTAELGASGAPAPARESTAAPAPLAGGTSVGAAPELHTVDPAARAEAPADPTRELFARNGQAPLRDNATSAPAANASPPAASPTPVEPAPRTAAVPPEDSQSALALRFPAADPPPVDGSVTTGAVRPSAPVPPPEVSATPPAGAPAVQADLPTGLRPSEPLPESSASEPDLAGLVPPGTPAPLEPGLQVTEPAAPDLETADPAVRMSSIRSAVNLRSGPSNDSSVIGVVADGASIEVISCEVWCEIVYDGKRGYVFRSFVSNGG